MFFQAEELGASPVERCISCKTALKDCRLCSSEIALLSAREMEEYNVLRDHAEKDDTTGRLHVRYPFNTDPSCLIKKQLKQGINKEYIQQFQDMVDRGVVSKIDQEELGLYQGPSNWIIHHEVYKDSNTTPVCSSFKNGNTSLNDILVKGPNSLLGIYGNLVKFRSYEIYAMR